MRHIILNKYSIDSKPLGKGLYASVYRGYDLINKKVVAIKITSNFKAANREVKVMKRYGRTGKLPVFHELITTKSKAYIVMEYVEGKSIEELYNRGNRYNEKESVRIVLNILKCLRRLHESGYSHMDVKPKNIIILDKNPLELKIVDFNVSRDINKKYMQRDLRCAAEVFLFLKNRGERKKMQQSTFKQGRLKPVMRKALNKKPQSGYKSATEFIKELHPLMAL